MEFQNLRFETDGAIGVLFLDRPKALNALDADTIRELLRCLREIRRANEIRALVVTGDGDKAFCAGADIAAMSTMSPVEGRDWARLGQRLTSAIEDLPIPVIAAVNGYALGGGMELAMACDLILASEKARFGQPEINLGILPGFGGTQRLARRVGAPIARELVYGGDMVDPIRLERHGLVNRVVAPEALLDEAKALARKLAEKPPVALAQAKLAIRSGLDVDLENGLRFEAEAFGVAFSSADRAEGMKAFLEKRKAAFTGK
jgi:enoyl-CoA hydratase